jgi:iron complex transport system permease protein
MIPVLPQRFNILPGRALPWMFVAAGAIVVCTIAIGPQGTWSSLVAPRDLDIQIVRQVRMPRVSLGLLAGAGLATAGMAFQALFRNALATPFTVGVSAGASLGAALYVYAGVTASVAGIPGQAFAAFAGAAASIALVYALGRVATGFCPATLLLAGVAVSFLCTSVILAIQYVSDVSTSFRVGRWLLGGLEVVGFAPVLHVVPFVVIGLFVIVAVSRELDLLVIGDESAASRGVAVHTVKQLVFGAAALMVGGVVATCGPIGFVGLIVPHIGRLLLGPRHRTLAPFCVVMGGAFLVVCDTVARTVIAPVEIPVGIVTALIGGPFFLALLVQGHLRIRLGRPHER